MGAWVADGWYSGYLGFGLLTGIGTEGIGRSTYGKTPALMAQLEIEYEDGSREVIVTDTSWKVFGDGPIREADFLMGESYDARRERPVGPVPALMTAVGIKRFWPRTTDIPGHVQRIPQSRCRVGGRSNQATAVDLGFRRPPKLEAFPGVPVRATEEIEPVAVTSPEQGVYIFDLGQNFAGVVRLKVKGPAGTRIRLRFGEMLHPDGRLMTENLRKARAHDDYMLQRRPGRRNLHTAIHLPRFPICRSHRLSGRAAARRDHRHCAAFRHAAGERVRVLRPDGQSAVSEHRLDAAGQLHGPAHRLSPT